MSERTLTIYDATELRSLEPTQGEIFFVDDRLGSDDNDGLTPGTAFQSITFALAQCSSAYLDTIFVLDYGHDEALDSAWPIPIDKHYVHIIGAALSGSHVASTVITAGAGAGCLSIDAWFVRIQGFQFVPAAAQPAITFSLSISYPTILDCAFHTGSYGIYSPTAGIATFHRFARNWFTGLTSGGILIDDDPASGRIEDNVFEMFQEVRAIDVVAGGLTQILNNRFAVWKSDAIGYAIRLGVLTSSTLVDGNRAASRYANPPVNPYLDLCNGAVHDNHWGLNHAGIAPIYPARA